MKKAMLVALLSVLAVPEGVDAHCHFPPGKGCWLMAKALSKAVAEADAGIVMKYWAKDGILVESSGVVVEHEKIEAALARQLEQRRGFTYEINCLDAYPTTESDTPTEVVVWNVTVKAPGDEVGLPHKVVALMVRQAEGDDLVWRAAAVSPLFPPDQKASK